jgi:alpha-tubulin suppressor-like RCC1 family protein
MGVNHQCVLLAANSAHPAKVLCWGSNGSGQLGTGGTTPLAAPTFSKPVLQAAGWEPYDIEAGEEFTCGLAKQSSTGARAVFCWGRNGSGQLGRGNLTSSGVPDVVQIAAGQTLAAGGVGSLAVGQSHACAMNAAGTAAHCWGANTYGQLGNGTETRQLFASPAAYVAAPIGTVAPTWKVLEVEALEANTCFLVDRTLSNTTTRHVSCVGAAGTNRVLPNPTGSASGSGTGGCAVTDGATGSTTYNCATKFGGLITFPQIYPPTEQLTCGSNHCLVLNATMQRILGWGKNASGQLSQSSTSFQAAPALSNSGYVPTGHTIRSLAAGGDSSYVVFTDNGVSGAGEGEQGQQFNGSLSDSTNFGSRGSGMLAFFAGRGAPIQGSTLPGTRACAIRANSELWCGGAFADPLSLGRSDCTANACTASNAYFRTIPWAN